MEAKKLAEAKAKILEEYGADVLEALYHDNSPQ